MLREKWAQDGGEMMIEQQARERSAQRNQPKRRNKSNKETVQVITKDLIRSLM